MRILVDIGHPAHVHLFRNLIKRVFREGGKAVATTRDKDVTVGLCDAYQIPQEVVSRASSGRFVHRFMEYLTRTIKVFQN